jgi:uncharacterized protein YggE
MRLAALSLLLSLFCYAQTSPSIQASGSATISVKPDQATLTVGVTTEGTTAQEAADRNATLADAVIKALDTQLNGAGTIQTISYSLYARYGVNSSSIIGYTANNTVQVVTTNLSLVGPLIDTANKAGANQIGGPTFGLQNSEPQKQQALAAASKQALTHTAAIASGLGAKTGAILSAQEGATVTPIVGFQSAAGAGAATPIQSGTVTVSATVTVTVALVQ